MPCADNCRRRGRMRRLRERRWGTGRIRCISVAVDPASPGAAQVRRTKTSSILAQVAPYAVPAALQLNQWGLEGKWLVDREKATLDSTPGKIVFKFYARDLHLVMGPGKDGKPVRFRVLLDGVAPVADHGVDTDEKGNGVVKEQRLYQLIRQSKAIGEHTFSIEFLDKDVQAFAFTFG